MYRSHWNSLQWIHRLYRRHLFRRSIHFIGLCAGLLIVAVQFLFFLSYLFSLEYESVNILFVILTGLWVWFCVDYFRGWSEEGFRIRSFFQRWESGHPDIANRASLLVYAEKQAEEIQRLGYSEELIEADDRWLESYIHDFSKQQKRIYPTAFAIILVFIILPALLFWNVRQDFFQKEFERISRLLWVVTQPVEEDDLRIPDLISVARGESVTLSAEWRHPDPQKDCSVFFRSQSDWNQQSVRKEGDRVVFHIPAVNREMEYYFAVGRTLSNKGRLIPIDPPSLIDGQVTITPPPYTGLPVQNLDRLRPFAVPEGSEVSISAQASIPLVSAILVYDDFTRSIPVQGNSFQTVMQVGHTGELSYQMEDEHGLIGQSRRYRITAIHDATPSLEIVHPKQISTMPGDMQLQVQIHAHDDYRLERLYKHVQINGEKPNHFTFLIWSNTPEEAASDTQTSVTTELFVSYDWNLAEYNLFPGDRVTFALEIFDNDPIRGPKSSRSANYVIDYPSLVDLLSKLDKMEKKQVDDLGSVVDKQKKITEDVQKTLDKISDKIKERENSAPGDESNSWMEEKELEGIKERQKELVEQARKIEEYLEQYKERAQEAAKQEDQSGFTPETLEKIEKIQELMQQLMDKDSQALLEKIDQTIDQMAKQITEEQLSDLNYSFQDYNQQLDRTLSMLENAFQSRQLEGLKQMADDLAQRQEHLQRETEKLADEKQQLDSTQSSDSSEENKAKQEQLESDQRLLEKRQEQLERDAQTLMDAIREMQESMKESSPAVAQKLEQMRQEAEQQGLMKAMSEAAQNMKSGQMKQAQKNQQSAMETLQSIAKQLQDQLFDMNGMSLQMDTQAISRLIYQGLFLSNQMEGLTESFLGRSEALDALRRAQSFQRELVRISDRWKKIAETNPFMNRQVDKDLRSSNDRLRQAIAAGQGEKWIGLHETRGSMMDLNSAVYQMMQDMQNMQQQMSQSQSQSMQQQMQQMISQQQSLQQMLQQIRQMGEQGEQMMEQLKQMAERQAMIRKEIEKMMQQYRHAQQLRNQLEGIYQEMKEVENLLKEGTNDENVEEKQKKIMTRMLEAGSMQEQDEYGQDREEEVAKTGLDAESPQKMPPVPLPRKNNRFLDRPPVESIPLPYREALKKYYIRLSEQVIP